MDEILKELARAAKAGVDNDMQILEVMKTLTERHLQLENHVAELNNKIVVLETMIDSALAR